MVWVCVCSCKQVVLVLLHALDCAYLCPCLAGFACMRACLVLRAQCVFVCLCLCVCVCVKQPGEKHLPGYVLLTEERERNRERKRKWVIDGDENSDWERGQIHRMENKCMTKSQSSSE